MEVLVHSWERTHICLHCKVPPNMCYCLDYRMNECVTLLNRYKDSFGNVIIYL